VGGLGGWGLGVLVQGLAKWFMDEGFEMDPAAVPTGVPRSQEPPPPLLGRHRALSILLQQGPRGPLFFMGEVPL